MYLAHHELGQSTLLSCFNQDRVGFQLCLEIQEICCVFMKLWCGSFSLRIGDQARGDFTFPSNAAEVQSMALKSVIVYLPKYTTFSFIHNILFHPWYIVLTFQQHVVDARCGFIRYPAAIAPVL